MKILVMEYLDVYCVGFLKKVPLLSLISIIPLSASNRKGGKLKNTQTRSHTDNFGENNVKCLIAKGICRFVPHSSAGGF